MEAATLAFVDSACIGSVQSLPGSGTSISNDNSVCIGDSLHNGNSVGCGCIAKKEVENPQQ